MGREWLYGFWNEHEGGARHGDGQGKFAAWDRGRPEDPGGLRRGSPGDQVQVKTPLVYDVAEHLVVAVTHEGGAEKVYLEFFAVCVP